MKRIKPLQMAKKPWRF